MENASAGMKSLCDDITVGREERRKCIKQLKHQAETIRAQARKFVNDSKQFQEEMRRGLRTELQDGKRALINDISVLRDNFRKKEREVKADLVEAGKIWNGMKEVFIDNKTTPK